jgi:hypothetical protein
MNYLGTEKIATEKPRRMAGVSTWLEHLHTSINLPAFSMTGTLSMSSVKRAAHTP